MWGELKSLVIVLSANFGPENSLLLHHQQEETSIYEPHGVDYWSRLGIPDGQV